MPIESKNEIQLEIARVLFIDNVGRLSRGGSTPFLSQFMLPTVAIIRKMKG